MNTNVTFLLKPNSVGLRVDKYEQTRVDNIFGYSRTAGIWGFVGRRVWWWPAPFLLYLVLLVAKPKNFTVPEAIEVTLSW